VNFTILHSLDSYDDFFHQASKVSHTGFQWKELLNPADFGINLLSQELLWNPGQTGEESLLWMFNIISGNERAKTVVCARE
jgi:hypothetical protein